MEIETATQAFSALSQGARLATLKMLIKAGPRGASAGEIAEAMKTPPPTMSFHLKELERSGLVHARKEGRRVIYSADYGGVRELIDFLLADCCGGDRRLCGPYVVIKESA
ncbi:ArsR/SmtB family transcription factor [Hyphococcus luteus]|uniref:Transcriptional regulator n=1 Tax=Hyphococcus luteus TaxID=2058213 RepID=A0A2S7K694_9PROT|nr:metalloregulator ArsR/SmtB family transcription factor [Marinicaulis flavus]PQA87996.1 transcriptional regulator [Marinicaulis flavus]